MNFSFVEKTQILVYSRKKSLFEIEEISGWEEAPVENGDTEGTQAAYEKKSGTVYSVSLVLTKFLTKNKKFG